jgi:hypothetical protein
MLAGLTPPEFPVRQTAQQRTRYEKMHFDMLSAAKMEELVQLERSDVPSPWAKLAETLNEGSTAHSHKITSFDSLLAAEAQGAADASAGMISTAVYAIWQDLNLPGDVDLDIQKSVRLVGAALAHSDQAKVGLPSLYIMSGLHALLRWNRRQRFKPNDVLDFAHAAGALGYCDMFLTEGPLKDMLGRGALKLAAATNCQVPSDPADAILAVAALLEQSDDQTQ